MARRRVCAETGATRIKIERARELRKAPTPAEALLWARLRGKSVGAKVRRQHVIRGWLVDFYIAAANLVIELDGEVHRYTVEEDRRREEALRDEGLDVMRLRNEEVLSDPAGVVARIAERVG